MTNDQIKIIKDTITEYFEYQKMMSKINDLIGDRLMLKLLGSGIDPKEAQEIYLETIVKHAVETINPKDFDFIKQFIEIDDDSQ